MRARASTVSPRSSRSRTEAPSQKRVATGEGYGDDVIRAWEATERVLESGGFESTQRAVVSGPVVESSEAGARLLGSAYWETIRSLTRGAIRARWTADGGRLTMFGRLNLLSFGRPELSFSDSRISCRYPIQGGVLALRPGGSIVLAQRRVGDAFDLSVVVQEYAPRLAARANAPGWTGALYAKVQSPFHAAVSRRYFGLLAWKEQ